MKALYSMFLAGVLVLPVSGAFEVRVPHGPLELEGTVTFAQPGDVVFFLQTSDGAAWRCAQRNATAVAVGDRIVVRGEVLPQTVNNRIDNCTVAVTRSGDGGDPEYEGVSIAQLNAHPVAGSSEPDRFARLVAVSGRVADVNRRVDAVQLVLADGEKCIGVSYRMKPDAPLHEGLAIGAMVRVKGVYVYVTEPKQAKQPLFTGISAPLVMLASSDELEVLSTPPFWTAARVTVALSAAALVAFGLVLWVVALRRTVTRQVALIEKALREKAVQDGARRERLRLSHDLHDDFQQLLTGAKFRITAALNWLDAGDSAKARRQLESACSTIVHTQGQLRAVLWGLQEESEGPGSLGALFRYAVDRMAHWNGVVNIRESGREVPLARTMAGGLLMILQEAVGNAIRHGKATKVNVAVSFEERRLLMSISDNGCGFDIGSHPTGFGLGGMEERAHTMNGTFALESAPGKGTRIRMEIPL